MSQSLNVALVGTDPDLFEAFYREHVDAVQRFVARRVDDPHVAADLTADILAQLIERLNQSVEGELDIRRRAFAATFRYGDGQVLPNMIGYRAGLCSAYSNSGSNVVGLASVLVKILGCPAGLGGSASVSLERTGCLFRARSDLVTPSRLSDRWLAGASSLKPSAFNVSAHGTLDGHALNVVQALPASLERC